MRMMWICLSEEAVESLILFEIDCREFFHGYQWGGRVIMAATIIVGTLFSLLGAFTE